MSVVANGDGGERLQRFLARAGVAPSRRKAEAWIEAGRVTVDGAVATLGAKVPTGAEVRVDGTRVERAHGRPTVLLLHKPAGVLSAASDDRGRTTVLELAPRVPGLHPVGRLDLDSEGLILLTDDGDLTQRLTHPRYEHAKRYRVRCRQGTVDEGALGRLARGVRLDDGLARADAVRPAPGGCALVLHEGRNRQVRRMLAAVGYDVTRLLRTGVADLRLGSLKPGEWREATEEERRTLGYDS